MSEIGSEELRDAEDKVAALLGDVHVPPEEMDWPAAGEKFLCAYEDFEILQGRDSERIQKNISRARAMLFEASEACGNRDYDAMKQAGTEAAYCLNQASHALQKGI